MNDRRTHSLPAFTVIEILLVIVILAISAAVVAPMVGGRDDVVMSAVTRKVIADFQYAQNYAIATRQSTYIKFAANQYQICTLQSGALVAMTHPVEKSPFTVFFSAGGDANLQRASLAMPSIAGESVLGYDALGAPFAFDESTQTRSSIDSVVALTLGVNELSQSIHIEPHTGEITVP